MTKKHYEAIAATFASFMSTSPSPQKAKLLRELACQQADAFAKDNPNFNRAHFLTACKVFP